ncbi:hypothetical protein CHU98_g11378 [Xylaria longipes]|nr:hypothetical protein CHU98_g11378 [Xylaria longipes]
MGFCKDQMIEQMQEEREDLEITLDEIEVYGKRFKCTITKDVDGQIVHRTEDEQRRICRSQEARGLHHANQQRNSGISRPRHGAGKGKIQAGGNRDKYERLTEYRCQYEQEVTTLKG